MQGADPVPLRRFAPARQQSVQRARKDIGQVGKVVCPENRVAQVIFRRSLIECRVRKNGRDTIRRLAAILHEPFFQEFRETERLVARRPLHLVPVLVPDAVTRLDPAALDLEDHETAPGNGHDEIAFALPAVGGPQFEAVPGRPAVRQ